MLDLGDATKITAIISENFNAVELLGLRQLMLNRDFKRIDEYERMWRERHGEPYLPDFVHNARPASGDKYAFHINPRNRVIVGSGSEGGDD